VNDEDEYFEDSEGDEEAYAVEWMSDCSSFRVGKTNHEVYYFNGGNGSYVIEKICTFNECPSYCGALIISDVVCDKEVFRAFVQRLACDTPYSQLICGDVDSAILLELGAINLGGFLLLEVCNVN